MDFHKSFANEEKSNMQLHLIKLRKIKFDVCF